MNKKMRRFRADYIKRGNEVGIGITEHTQHWDKETIAIHSLYIDGDWSNREISVNIFQRICNLLKDNEHALIQMHKYSFKKGYDLPYRNRLCVQNIESFRGRSFQSWLLADDALRRKTDICTVFDEPFHFSVIEAEKEYNDV